MDVGERVTAARSHSFMSTFRWLSVTDYLCARLNSEHPVTVVHRVVDGHPSIHHCCCSSPALARPLPVRVDKQHPRPSSFVPSSLGRRAWSSRGVGVAMPLH